ncbi:putative uncharacterized protein DDB_G0287457 [Amphibalanus amphitrite]|uniref:putative uncharacterized protein DDB_G0287457 n=1 Tax=Amphibalanus amphitrite TaxID=1232801 RepID=UPI001C8FB631|nr:putative uncharacterized protein DDB_G0287457 [Amphibalanus amphitrite]
MALSALPAGSLSSGISTGWTPWSASHQLTARSGQVRSGRYSDLALGQLPAGESWEPSRRPRSFAAGRRPLVGVRRPVVSRRRGHGPPTAAPQPPTPTTSAAPPVVWFPDLSDECEPPAKSSSSFNAFGFLAFVLSAVNLVSLLSSNVNNNINNNNNNNNNNDNNDINTNEDNANTNQNVLNQVMIAPGRRRREAALKDNSTQTWRAKTSGFSGDQVKPISGSEVDEVTTQSDPKEATLLVVYSVLVAWSEAVVTADRCCALRAVCEAGDQGRALGRLGQTLVDVFSAALAEVLQWETPGTSLEDVLQAAAAGDCDTAYPCSHRCIGGKAG